MGTRARLFIFGGDLVCEGPADARLPLTDEAIGRMRAWVEQYRAAVDGDDPALLLSIGREMLGWLDGAGWASGWLRRAGERVLEIAVDSDDAEVARLLLDLPWETLADDQDFLAADPAQPFVVFRGIGRDRRSEPARPVHRDLAVMFMAASPAGEQPLAYEAEETAILEATERLPVQVAVEESGCAEFLKDRLAQEGPFEVVHVSCHGGINGDGPVLALESPEGDLVLQTPGDLAGALGEDKPSLVFVSACRTAESGEDFTEPFVRALVRSGVHNVLGWDGSVYDVDATRFAETFYGELAQHTSVPFAASVARRRVLHAHRGDPRTGHHWHLARVYAGPGGAGGCCERGMPKRRLRRDVGYKEFLDKARNRVPVATAREFVGRRRQAQAVLRVFREGSNAGAMLLGMGNLGKSSLAARVANRMPRYRAVVIYEHYDARAIFEQLIAALPANQRAACEQSWSEQLANDGAVLEDMLCELLEGPFDEQPILMVIDDLEQILEPPRPGQMLTLVADGPGNVDVWRSALGSVLRAFAAAETESRLLLTSRFDFTLADGRGGDLAADLARVHLPPTDGSERVRQWQAAQRVAGHTESEESEEERKLVRHAQGLAGGNPGLQAILCRPILAGQLTVARDAMEAIARWKASGKVPEDENAAQEFFRRLTFETYRDALTEQELEQLRASTLFAEGLPIPVAALEAAGGALGVGDPGACLQRLIGLGLVDHWGELAHDGPHASVNALARPLRSRDLTAAEQVSLAARAMGPIALAWEDEGGNFPSDERGAEAGRLALMGDVEVDVLNSAAGAAGRFLFHGRHDARAALGLLQQVLARIGERGEAPSGQLLLLAANCAMRVGEAELHIALLQRGLALETCDPIARAQISAEHAVATIADEGPEKALTTLHEAASLFAGSGDERSQAVTMGKIAEILARRGEVDEALRIRREEQLSVFERLGDVRGRADAMGKIADILQLSGEVDEALRIRQEEQLPVYERLGDVRAIAVAKGKIADILARRGEVDQALRIWREEQLPVFERLGDVRERAVAMSKIADVLLRRGEVDEALRIRREEQLPVYERLGDARAITITKGKIADILAQRGEVDEAWRIYKEGLAKAISAHDVDLIAHIRLSRALLRIQRGGLQDGETAVILEELTESFTLYQRLRQVDGIARAGGALGQVLSRTGAVSEAASVLEESAAAYEQLGQSASAAQVRGFIVQPKSDLRTDSDDGPG